MEYTPITSHDLETTCSEGKMSEALKNIEDVSKRARASFFWFVVFEFYLAVVVGETTHEQLVRGSVMTMPTIEVGLPVKGFYILVPPILILFHLHLLYCLRDLRDVISRSTKELAPDQRLVSDQMPGPMSRYIAFVLLKNNGKNFIELALSFFIRLSVIFAVAILPVFLLIFVLIRFLPYHHDAITMLHRLYIFFDILALWIFWTSVSVKKSGGSPISFANKYFQKYVSPILSHCRKRFAVFLLLFLPCIWFSMLVATFPGEALERWAVERHDAYTDIETCSFSNVLNYSAHVKIEAPSGRGLRTTPCLTYLLFEAPDTPLDMRRNLYLEGVRLVRPSMADRLPEDLNQENTRGLLGIGFDLRGRDLRYAKLQNAELQQADLRGADLKGADLTRADLRLADFRDVKLIDLGACEPELRDGTHCRTNLSQSRLNDADLQWANLWKAYLPDADLSNAQLQGVSFEHAKMEGVKAHGARLHGAKLVGASLERASLERAKAIGADFTRAQFRDASLKKFVGEFSVGREVEFHRADLTGARFNGALMDDAKFAGSTLERAEFYAANLRKVDLSSIKSQTFVLDLAVIDDDEMCDEDLKLSLSTYAIPEECRRDDQSGNCDDKRSCYLLGRACHPTTGRWAALGLGKRIIKETEPLTENAPKKPLKTWHLEAAERLLEYKDDKDSETGSTDTGDKCIGAQSLPQDIRTKLMEILEHPRFHDPKDTNSDRE